MCVGIDVVNKGVESIIGLAASNSSSMTQYFSRIAVQTLFKKEVKGGDITKDE